MVEVALEDRLMAKMYGRVVFKFMNKILEVGGPSTEFSKSETNF
jgi:phosphatidylinositol 3-kinase